jgi:hypothetical protein
MLYAQAGFDMEEPELMDPPHAGERTVGGVPAHLWLKAARSSRSAVWNALRGNGTEAFSYELWLCFFAGIVRQRWVDRRARVAAGPATARRAESKLLSSV